MTIEEKALDREWSILVRQRDRHTCRFGWKGCQGKATDAAHVFSRIYRELRWEPANGVAACRSCHRASEKNAKATLEFLKKRIPAEDWETIATVMRVVYGKVV